MHAGQANVPVTRRVAGIHIVAWRNPRSLSEYSSPSC
jgi:hypothetical protein